MYAKVHKNRSKTPSTSTSTATTTPTTTTGKDEQDHLNRGSERSSFHTAQRKISNNSSPLAEEEEEIDKTRDSDQIHQTNYDEKKYIRKEHDYETLKKQFHISDCGSEPGYASINGPDSLLSMDPGYEVLKRQEAETSSEIDPNYEPLRHRTDSAGYCTIRDQVMDGYSVINKQRKMEDRQAKNCGKIESDEPNYESMPSDYAGGAKSTDSESDPNYESVNQNDPNYESVKYLDVNDPPYERLNDDDFTIGGSNKGEFDRLGTYLFYVFIKKL